MNFPTFFMGVLPSLGLGGLFFFVMRGIIRADRREREAIAQRLIAEHGDQPAE